MDPHMYRRLLQGSEQTSHAFGYPHRNPLSTSTIWSMDQAHNLFHMLGHCKPLFLTSYRKVPRCNAWHASPLSNAVGHRLRILHCTCSNHSRFSTCNQLGMAECYSSSLPPKASTLLLR